jgi:protein-S-isoprenylcysteine O-methyltransferase Ste14
MTKKLFFKAIIRFFLGLIFVSLCLFLPAGTLRYPNGLLFIVILFVPMFIVGIVMMILSPKLLEKRLNVKETEKEQKTVITLSGLMFIAAFVAAGLDFRFGWTALPPWAVIAGVLIFFAAYIMYAEVLRENEYLSRTIEIQENQKVIDTGLYGIVRHPMYSATLFLFLSSGIILGSLVSFAILLFYVPIIAYRMINEEKVLEEGLLGYTEYKKRVKYKVIPFVW